MWAAGDVDGLHAAHIENDKVPCLQLRFQRRVKLVGGAEEQAALKFDDHATARRAQ